MPAGPVPTLCRELLCRCSCNIYACWPCVTVTNTAAVQACLLVECCCQIGSCWTFVTQIALRSIFCHSILHVCWCCVSLSTIPAGMVSHYQPCLLVWCLTIGHVFWRGASYQQCLQVWCLIIVHAFCCGVSLSTMSVKVGNRPVNMHIDQTSGHY